MIHICVGTIIGSDNGLSPGRRQAITWTNVGILLIGPLGTNFSEMLIEIHTFSFKKIHLKMSSGKWWPFCLGLNVLTHCGLVMSYGTRHHGQLSQFQVRTCFLTSTCPLYPTLVQLQTMSWTGTLSIVLFHSNFSSSGEQPEQHISAHKL